MKKTTVGMLVILSAVFFAQVSSAQEKTSPITVPVKVTEPEKVGLALKINDQWGFTTSVFSPVPLGGTICHGQPVIRQYEVIGVVSLRFCF